MKEEAHDFTRGSTGSPERSQEQCIDHYVEWFVDLLQDHYGRGYQEWYLSYVGTVFRSRNVSGPVFEFF